MYLDFYGLTQAPFDLTPNPRFLFHSAKHREAINHLLYGIRERKGFVQLTGEVGAGKTTLCRALLEQLDSHYSTALILNPVLSAEELMKAIATEFGLDANGRDRLGTVAAINEFLLQQAEHRKEAVLIIDEAQDLTDELLEQVRLLSNIETDDRKLLQIVLIGQPELRDRLNSPRLRQLRQRITVRYHLAPLTRFEVAQYIQHRLELAGAKGAPYFTQPALWRVSVTAAASRGWSMPFATRLCSQGLSHSRPHQLSHGGPRHPRTRRGHSRMSLINDALKRARQTQQNKPPAGGARPLIPVEARPRGGAGWLLPMTVGALIAAACFFFGLATARHRDKRCRRRRNPSRRRPPSLADAPAPPAPPPAPPPATPAPGRPAPPHGPKLQGIVFDPARPWAIVDGKTVYAGDRVGEFLVKEISRSAVTLERADKTRKVLALGR